MSRWTHLLRFSDTHTGYATLSPARGVYTQDRLLAVGDNVHAPGQTVATWSDDKGRWLARSGEPVTVLVRPKRGQPASQPSPHKVVRWVTEYHDSEGERAGLPPEAALCIPWFLTKGPHDGEEWEPAPFRPTCDDVSRRIEANTHRKE